MHYYLSVWSGDGDDAPYQPEIGAAAELDGTDWWAIDLRPDPTVTAGRALVACAARPAVEIGARYLGDELDAELPLLVRTRLATELGLSLTRADLRRVVVELLTDHARENSTRWRPLRPLRRGRHAWEIHLGGLLWALPRVAGGASHTESFSGADNLSLAAADVDLTWALVTTGWSVSGNQGAILGISSGTTYARAEHDSVGTDTYAQASLIEKTDVGGFVQFGPCVRFDSGANTSYMACRGQDATTDLRLRKTVSGSRSNLASAATVPVALPELVRVEAGGSTIRALLDGDTYSTVTDTSIATGIRAGIYGFRPSGGTLVIDLWEFGDLVGELAVTPAGISPAEVFGSPTLTPGPATIAPDSLTPSGAFGTAAVTPGPTTVTPSGIGPVEQFGTPVVTAEAVTVTITPAGILSSGAIGAATLTPAPVVAEHGAKAVRDRVAALLVADLGGRIDAMCELWALDAAAFPAPDRVIPHGDTPADPSYPGTLAVTSGEPPDFALDHTARSWVEVITPRLMPKTQTWGLTPRGNLLYRFRYACKLYVWAIGDTWAGALDARDRLAVAVRDCLFDLRTLQAPPAYGDSGYLVDPNTMSEEFGAPFRIAGKTGTNPRVRAAALLNYEIVHEHETGVPTTRPNDGPYTGYDLAVTLLPWTRPMTED